VKEPGSCRWCRLSSFRSVDAQVRQLQSAPDAPKVPHLRGCSVSVSETSTSPSPSSSTYCAADVARVRLEREECGAARAEHLDRQRFRVPIPTGALLVHVVTIAGRPSPTHLQSAGPLCVCPKHHDPRAAWHPPVHAGFHWTAGSLDCPSKDSVALAQTRGGKSLPRTAMRGADGAWRNPAWHLATARSLHVPH
jgi:hypothetical protein